MEKNIPELKVLEACKDGRRKFDEQRKRALIEACLEPGVSASRMAQTHDLMPICCASGSRYLLAREKACQKDAPQPQSVATQASIAAPRWSQY